MNIYSILPLITSLLLSFLGLFVYLKKSKNNLNRAFFILCISSCIWLLFASIAYITDVKNSASWLLKISYSGVVFIAVSQFHLTVELLQLPKRKKLIILNYLIGIFWVVLIWTSLYVIADVNRYFWGYYPIAGHFHPFFLCFFVGLVVSSFVFLSYFLFIKEEPQPIKRVQMKYLFLALIVFSLGSIDFLPNYKIEIYPFGYIPSLIFISITGYAILRYRLMDIYLVIKRTAAYSLSAGLLTAVFAMLVITATNLLSSFANVSSLKVSIVAALIIALLFNPLRNKIQSLIDKLFYKRTYDYYQTLEKVSRELESMFNLDRIYSFVGEVIYSTLGLKNIFILEANDAASGYETVFKLSKKDKGKRETSVSESKSSDGQNEIKINNRSELIKLIRRSKDIIIKDELSDREKDIGIEIIDWVKRELKEFDCDAVVPVFFDKKLSLLLILGGKLSGDLFSKEDINLLNTVSNQMAIALKNAALYRDKVNSERLASIGMMSATFAHEVRNPLTSLKTFAQLMPEKYNDPEFRDTFSRIVEGEIERIDGLISDLLDFSTQKKSSRVNNFNLVDLVDETVDYVKGKLDFERKKIVIEKNYYRNKIDMSGDAMKLKRVFVNIITNGCQAMNGEGILKVDINTNGKHVDVAITDTGEGIRPDDISKIFDPFVTTKEMGIGLGLAISKRIVEDHRGRIDVKSKLSEGTTFTISLPVQN